MATEILLIRHASHADVGQVLSGRGTCPGLTEQGHEEARALAARLAYLPIERVETSPVRRAAETARIVAETHGLPVMTSPAINEIDFGAWTGRSFAALADEPDWQRWNRARADGVTPGGETMRGVQARATAHLHAIAAAHPDATVAMVTHGDVIRALVAGALGLSLDAIHRFAIDPATFSRLHVDNGDATLVSLNERAR